MVTRMSASGSLSRCAASRTPLAPPPTMMIASLPPGLPVIRQRSPTRIVQDGDYRLSEKATNLLWSNDRNGFLELVFDAGQHVVIGGVAHLGEAAVVEHLGDRLAHLEHHVADLAGLLVAILARLVLRAAGAGDRRQRAVEDANDVADLDLGRQASETIAAVLALAALHETGV